MNERARLFGRLCRSSGRTTRTASRGTGSPSPRGRGNELCVAAIEALAPARRRSDARVDRRPTLGAFWYAARRATASSAGSAPRRASSTSPPARRRQRRLGPVRQGRGQAALEAPRRHDARGARPLRPVPLHHRRADARRGPRHPAPPGADASRPRGRDARRRAIPAYTTSTGWLGYPDDEDPPAVPGGRRGGLDATSSSRSGVDLDDDIRRVRASCARRSDPTGS